MKNLSENVCALTIIFLILLIFFAPIALSKQPNMTTNGVTVGGSEPAPVAGDATRQDTRVNVVLEITCLTKPIVLIDCEVLPSGDVRNCRSAKVTFRPRCGSLELTHGK